jgi:hypothetical protein
MLSRIEEGLRDGDFYFNLSFLAETEHLTDPAMKEDYEYVFKACPGVAWDAHRYWQVFYDGETAPIGYDTPEAVYEGVF